MNCLQFFIYNTCGFIKVWSHWTVTLYTTTTTITTCQLHHCKILFIYINRRPWYCCLCKNPRSQPLSSWILFLFNILAFLYVGPPT